MASTQSAPAVQQPGTGNAAPQNLGSENIKEAMAVSNQAQHFLGRRSTCSTYADCHLEILSDEEGWRIRQRPRIYQSLPDPKRSSTAADVQPTKASLRSATAAADAKSANQPQCVGRFSKWCPGDWPYKLFSHYTNLIRNITWPIRPKQFDTCESIQPEFRFTTVRTSRQWIFLAGPIGDS